MNIVRPQSDQPLPNNAKKVFSGIIFDVYQWEQVQFDGTIKTFEKISRLDTVGVIAVTIDKKIILTRQEQPGMKPFIGTSGGIIDRGEDPLTAAQRELMEETGYESTKWELFDASQPTTKIDWSIFNFLAKDSRKRQEPRLDSGEKVTVEQLSFDEFIEAVKNPDFRDKDLALKILRQISDLNGLQQLKEKLLG